MWNKWTWTWTTISPHCAKMTKKSLWELRTIQDFCPPDIESCHLTAARRVKLWLLNANLFFNPFSLSFAKRQYFFLTDKFSQSRHKNVECLNLVHARKPKFGLLAIAVPNFFLAPFLSFFPAGLLSLPSAYQIHIIMMLQGSISCANGNAKPWSEQLPFQNLVTVYGRYF